MMYSFVSPSGLHCSTMLLDDASRSSHGVHGIYFRWWAIFVDNEHVRSLRLSSFSFPCSSSASKPTPVASQLVHPFPRCPPSPPQKSFAGPSSSSSHFLHLCSCSPSQDGYVTTAHPMRSHDTRGAHGPPPGSGTQLARICYLRPI